MIEFLALFHACTIRCVIYPPLSDCKSEQAAAGVLGFTQVSWDDLSGQELQPSSVDKYWTNLTDSERAAAVVLGYTQTTWDNESGSEPQPASADKQWFQLISCGENPSILDPLLLVRVSA